MISGLRETEGDEEVSVFLQKYGSISHYFRIDDPKSDFHKHMIVEFTHSSAMQTLEPLLPLKVPSQSLPDHTNEIKTLPCVYIQDVRDRAKRFIWSNWQKLLDCVGNQRSKC